MSFQEEYDEMNGMEEDDIPILDVGRWYSIEDFMEDTKDYNIKPTWVIIDNIIYKRKSEQEMERIRLNSLNKPKHQIKRKQ